MCVCNLPPAAHKIPAELRGDREWAGSHYFQVRVVRSHCSPNRTPAETWGARERCWGWEWITRSLWLHYKLNSHLSIVHYCQRWGLTTGDTDSHFVLQATGHSAWCGLVRCGAWAHLTTVVVAPRIHLAGRKLKVGNETKLSNVSWNVIVKVYYETMPPPPQKNLNVKAAVSVLANFLSVLQEAIPLLLSMSPHEHAVVITRHSSRQEDPALCVFTSRQDRLSMEFSDWIKLAGMPESFLSLLLHEQREERHRLLTKHSQSVIIVGIYSCFISI